VTEVHVELLLGRRVLDPFGRPIGRLEELLADDLENETVISEYHVGSYAVLERLSAWRIGRAVLDLFGARRSPRGYRVPWDKLDLSDPAKPRLTCPVEQLEVLK
jgi:hypothetical protein